MPSYFNLASKQRDYFALQLILLIQNISMSKMSLRLRCKLPGIMNIPFARVYKPAAESEPQPESTLGAWD